MVIYANHRRRTVSSLTAPAYHPIDLTGQIPACGTITPRSSELFASAKALTSTNSFRDDWVSENLRMMLPSFFTQETGLFLNTLC